MKMHLWQGVRVSEIRPFSYYTQSDAVICHSYSVGWVILSVGPVPLHPYHLSVCASESYQARISSKETSSLPTYEFYHPPPQINFLDPHLIMCVCDMKCILW